MIENVGTIIGLFSEEKSAKVIANLIFLLPAVTFGAIWFFEKNSLEYYILTVVSLVIGVFIIIWTFIKRMVSTSDYKKIEQDFKSYGKSSKDYSNPAYLKTVPKKCIFATILWFVLLLYAIYQTIISIEQEEFAGLFLVQVSALTYMFSIRIFSQDISQAGIKISKAKRKGKR